MCYNQPADRQMSLIALVLLSSLILAGSTSFYAQVGEAAGSDPVILTDRQDEYPLGLHLEILEDPTGELTVEDVSSPEFDSRFAPSLVDNPNFGFTESAYWVRLPLQNDSQEQDRWLLDVAFANMHFVDLFAPLPGGEGYAARQSGTLRSPDNRDIRYPHIVFSLTIPGQSRQTIYLRFESDASMALPLTLWTPDAFLIESQWEHLAYGVYFGVLIALLLYNLFVFISLREISYLYLVLVLAGMLSFDAAYSGYLTAYIAPGLYGWIIIYMPPAFALIFVPTILFADTFLELKAQLPKLHRLNTAIMSVWGVLVLLSPFASYHQSAVLMAPTALLTLGAVMVAGMITWLRGFRPARFFMLAWFGLVATLTLALLARLGAIPATEFSDNAFRLGMMWMAVCWSIALADRINLLKAETENANRELQNNEHRLAQILEGLPLGVVVYGSDQKPNFANQRVAEILSNPERGIRPDLSAGRTLAQAMDYYSFRVAGTDRAYPLEEFPVYRALHGEPVFANDIEADLQDRQVPLEIWASPVRSKDDNVESAVVVFQDITQRKRAEAELDEYRKHLELLVEKRTAELSAINEWLDALNKSHQTIRGMEDLPQTYRDLAPTILQLFGAGALFLLHWDGPDKQPELLNLSQQNSSTPELAAGLESLFYPGAALRQEIAPGKIICLSASQETPLPLLEGFFQSSGCRSLILAPMTVHQAVVGVLGLATTGPQKSDHQESDLLDKIALDLAQLEQNARFLDQTHALVAAEERNRLARDLHDSVTQVLFAASLVAEVLPQIWRRDPERAMQSIAELRQLTHGALAEMRTMLLELRPAALTNTSLAELLAQLTEAVTSRTKLPFQLFLEQVSDLPADVHVAFYRIAQEVLNNVVRHSQASRVTVSLSATPPAPTSSAGPPGEVRLAIADNGVGFSLEYGRSEHLGFGIMQERADAIGAQLAVDSRPGYGTQVTLVWQRDSGS